MSTQPAESGTFVLLPPQHRLFAVFDDPAVGADVAAQLRAGGGADDVWTFFGDKGIRSLDAHVRHHSLPVAIVRALQYVMTNDCEYCQGLADALAHGAVVLAVRVDEAHVDDLSARLRRQGGHRMAYGQHWNFMPVEGAGHAVGFFSEEAPEPSGDGSRR